MQFSRERAHEPFVVASLWGCCWTNSLQTPRLFVVFCSVVCFQIAARPPTVAIFCNNPKLFGDNYKRYLDRKFREQVNATDFNLSFYLYFSNEKRGACESCWAL